MNDGSDDTSDTAEPARCFAPVSFTAVTVCFFADSQSRVIRSLRECVAYK